MDEKLLKNLGFVFTEDGRVRLGTEKPLPCRLEGYRKNETPIREFDIEPFWISKFCATNLEYEKYDPKHRRPITSRNDKHPVTEITYMNAISYAGWLSKQTGVNFDLPTEQQWVFAAAPFGYEYPWGMSYSRNQAHVFTPDLEGTLEADDARFGTNWLGLYHIGGNIQEFVLGTAYAPGTNGALVDGMYCIIKGGDWSHCPRSAGIHRRGIVDVAGRGPTLGFRLVANL
ncbi:MAG: SUMF1/EgtB/PvdO family nonheme iron enzyme [bacterium]|nr:SUMF1/EgtB/PvdO family nonheme iron enzyme [bacterium]